MNRWRIFLEVLASVALLGVLAFGTAKPAAAASIIYVKASASGLNNGSSWANAYKSLQTALAHAVSGQQIWVAKGTYKPSARPVWPSDPRGVAFSLKNGVAIFGGFASTETSLSQRNWKINVTLLSGDIGTVGVTGDNAYDVIFGNGANSTAILDGFRITGGYASCGCFPGDAGGGVFLENSNPTLRNLIISGNYASGYGGGLYDSQSSPALANVTFSSNTTNLRGGGMYNSAGSNPTLNNVIFSNNRASFGGDGGGIYNDSSNPKLNRVTFTGNTATNNGGGMFNTNNSNPALGNVSFSSNTASNGGAIYNLGASPTLSNASFGSNSASFGGGIYDLNGSSPTIRNATFSSNSALNDGGGIYNDGGSSPILTNVTLNGNTASAGGAIFNETNSSPRLTNVTVSGNTATSVGGMENDSNSNPLVQDSIFWGDGTPEISNTGSTSAINDSIVQTGCPITGGTCSNVSVADPRLAPLNSNGGVVKTMALTSGSAAIDMGNSSTCAIRDERGVARPQGQACDMGAYEVRAATFLSQGMYDGQVLESLTIKNVGGSVDSTSAVLHIGDNASDKRYRGFLSFDTSALPDAATVVFARVTVKQQAPIVGNPFGTLGNMVADLAKPYFGTGVTLVNADWQAAATVPAAGLWQPDGSLYWTTLNNAGLSRVNKLGTTQIRLRFTLAGANHLADYVTVYSGNAATLGLRPAMTVYYNP